MEDLPEAPLEGGSLQSLDYTSKDSPWVRPPAQNFWLDWLQYCHNRNLDWIGSWRGWCGKSRGMEGRGMKRWRRIWYAFSSNMMYSTLKASLRFFNSCSNASVPTYSRGSAFLLFRASGKTKFRGMPSWIRVLMSALFLQQIGQIVVRAWRFVLPQRREHALIPVPAW